MVVPGKNLFNNSAEGKKKIYLYGGFVLIGIVLIVGIFFLIKYLVLAPEKEENITENDIDKILNSIKKDDHTGAETQAYGGITEPEKELKKNFENIEATGINKNSVINSKVQNQSVTTSKIEPSKPKNDVLDKKESTQKNVQKEPEHKKEAVVKKEVENKKTVVEKKEPERKKEVIAKVAPEPKKIEIKKEEEPTKNDNKDFKFTIQIASFKNSKSADDDKKNLEKRKFTIDLKQVDLGDKGIWYRLRVGKYKSRDEAQNELWMIKSIGYNNAVVTPY